MKTLVIRRGARHTIRAIATPSNDGGRDKCETLAFFQEQALMWPKEMLKLGALLTETALSGPPRDEKKFKSLPGTDGLFEFKTHIGLRLNCFWDDGGLIVCTHGYVKDKHKAPKTEIQKAERLKRDYFIAKKLNQLEHG
jgi:hypothetical protein